jgi:hypothetical protein
MSLELTPQHGWVDFNIARSELKTICATEIHFDL